VKLAKQMNWAEFDKQFETHFSEEGRPAIATRLMVALHYLKYSHDLSDEDTIALWVENPYWQYLSGRQHFEHKFPIDPSSMTRWRARVGVAGAETLLSQTILTAVKQGYLKRTQFSTVNRWLNGKNKPSKIQAYQIEKLLKKTNENMALIRTFMVTLNA